MTGFYTHLWTNKYGVTATREWEMCLDGITPEMLSDGLKRMVREGRFKRYPPNPIEFRELCFPSCEEFGLPSFDAAYREAVNNIGRSPEWRKWSCAAVYQAVCDAGFAVLKTGDEREARAQFQKAYEGVIKRVMFGEKLELPEAERITKTERPCTREQSKAHVANLKQSLGF